MSRNKKIIILLAIVVIVAGGLYIYFDNRTYTPDISINDAENIALEDCDLTRDNSHITTSYDNEDNEYEIDIYSTDGSSEYEYSISGKNGKILSKDFSKHSSPSVENNSNISNNSSESSSQSSSSATITSEEAQSAALKDSGFSLSEVEILKKEYDIEDNSYDIEFIATDSNDNIKYKYEYEINASNSNIISKNKDRDLY